MIPQVLGCVELLASGVDQTDLSDAEYLGSILGRLVIIWNLQEAEDCKQAASALLRRLITGGADLHYSSSDWETTLTPLQGLVADAEIGHELRAVSEWLGLLDDCGVDIDVYLLEEADFCSRPFEMRGPSRLRIRQFQVF